MDDKYRSSYARIFKSALLDTGALCRTCSFNRERESKAARFPKSASHLPEIHRHERLRNHRKRSRARVRTQATKHHGSSEHLQIYNPSQERVRGVGGPRGAPSPDLAQLHQLVRLSEFAAEGGHAGMGPPPHVVLAQQGKVAQTRASAATTIRHDARPPARTPLESRSALPLLLASIFRRQAPSLRGSSSPPILLRAANRRGGAV